MFWYATAVDGDERLRAARAVLMQTAGNQLLAGSRFSLNEDVRGWIRQIENELSHAPDRGRTADNGSPDAALTRELGPERSDLGDEGAIFGRPPRDFDQSVGRERLFH